MLFIWILIMNNACYVSIISLSATILCLNHLICCWYLPSFIISKFSLPYLPMDHVIICKCILSSQRLSLHAKALQLCRNYLLNHSWLVLLWWVIHEDFFYIQLWTFIAFIFWFCVFSWFLSYLLFVELMVISRWFIDLLYFLLYHNSI